MIGREVELVLTFLSLGKGGREGGGGLGRGEWLSGASLAFLMAAVRAEWGGEVLALGELCFESSEVRGVRTSEEGKSGGAAGIFLR